MLSAVRYTIRNWKSCRPNFFFGNMKRSCIWNAFLNKSCSQNAEDIELHVKFSRKSIFNSEWTMGASNVMRQGQDMFMSITFKFDLLDFQSPSLVCMRQIRLMSLRIGLHGNNLMLKWLNISLWGRHTMFCMWYCFSSSHL